MKMLSETVGVFRCPDCGYKQDYDEWEHNPYGTNLCESCNKEVVWDHDRKAEWWSVGVFTTCREYGGPEEGGWWYTRGDICEEWRVRGFKNLQHAQAYMMKLRKIYDAQGDATIVVDGFTEQLPDMFFPKHKPEYC